MTSQNKRMDVLTSVLSIQKAWPPVLEGHNAGRTACSIYHPTRVRNPCFVQPGRPALVPPHVNDRSKSGVTETPGISVCTLF